MPTVILDPKLDYVVLRRDIGSVVPVNLNLRDGSIVYTGIAGKSVPIKQTFNYLQIFNESADHELFVCLHKDTEVVAASTQGVIRVPAYGGVEETTIDVGWISMIASDDITVSIILRQGGLI